MAVRGEQLSEGQGAAGLRYVVLERRHHESPGPLFCWYVRNTYLENNLRIPGKTIQCGEAVNLSLIDVPTFVYASREDHIVPWRTAFASTQLLSHDTTFVL